MKQHRKAFNSKLNYLLGYVQALKEYEENK